MERKKIGIAFVGVGEYTTSQLLPALQYTAHCHLAALVSGDKDSLGSLGKQYSIKSSSLYTYDDFDAIGQNPDVDIVYIVLPNSLHAGFAVRAARLGKHIICEKPMAMQPDECRYMIEAAKQAGVQLSMGYRLHFDPFHREMMRLGTQQVLGPVKRMTLRCSMEAKDGEWRLDQERSGGGPLMNNGVYCIQAAIYLTGKLPTTVSAQFLKETEPGQFEEVEQGIKWTLHFGDNVVADCESRYDKEEDLVQVDTENGWFKLEPAFGYSGQKGISSAGPITCQPVNQQAEQMDDFAKCIIEGRPTRVPGEMGMRDMEIIASIYDSAKRDTCVQLSLSAYASLQEY